MMEAKALKKHIRSSQRKMRLVIDLIRGKKAYEALTMLKFNNKLASTDAEMVLRSAIANLDVKAREEGINISDDDIFIKEAYVNCGPSMKRILPAPMGRAFRIRKRSNHLTIVVEAKE